MIDDAAAVEALAASVARQRRRVLVPAFTGLGSPCWDPHARGHAPRHHPRHGRGHLARATLESMAFQTRDVVEAMAAAGGVPIRDAAGRRRRVGERAAAAARRRPAPGAGGPAR